MKKLLFLLILSIFFLNGCTYNLNTFVLPDDAKFFAIVESLTTPKEIVQYMKNNFTFATYGYTYALDPYTLWKTKKGDCDDFSNFATFIAHHHGYETWQITLIWDWHDIPHRIAVYKEGNSYSISGNLEYSNGYTSIQDILSVWIKSLDRYIIYDYEMNILEDWNK
jgi:hypothetical protein